MVRSSAAHDVRRRAARAEQERREEQDHPDGLGTPSRRQNRTEQDADGDEGHRPEPEPEGDLDQMVGRGQPVDGSGDGKQYDGADGDGHQPGHRLGQRERPTGEARRRETAQHPPLTVGRQVDRHHDQPGGGDDDGEIGGHIPLRRVHPVECNGWRCAERATDDEHGDDGKHEDEDQRQRFADHQLQLGPHQAADGTVPNSTGSQRQCSSRRSDQRWFSNVGYLVTVALQEAEEGVLQARDPC